MMKRLAIAVALALVACESPVESELERDLWESLAIRDYEFVYTVGCFCGFLGPNPAKLTVRDGVVVKVEAVGPAPLPNTTPPAATYPTVDTLFAVIERARREDPATLTLEYDETYHFPRLIALDPIAGVADDEVTYRVEQFRPLTVPASSVAGSR